MPDVRVLLEHDLLGGKGVQHAVVLHVGAGANDDAAHIATQRRPGTYIAPRTNDDVPDEDRLWMNKGGRIDDRNHTFE
jgi:hypothetical protein